MLTTCKAIVTGKRNGARCEFPRSAENEYCGRHQRNYKHEMLVKDDKTPCLDFFRGCDSLVAKSGRCDACREKKSVKKTPCGKEHCPNKTTGAKYCGKHQKQIYVDEEKEKNIKYCDIDRSCFNLRTPGYSTCETCRSAAYEKEKSRKGQYKENHNAIILNKDAKNAGMY